MRKYPFSPRRLCSLKPARFTSSYAVKYAKRGVPEQCLALEKEEVDLSLTSNEIAIRMVAAPINPSDLNMVEGSYKILPALPAVGGNEGLATVSAVGSGVTDFAVGDWVVPITPGFGTWRELAKGPAANFMKISKTIPQQFAACISVNPCTAYRLLHDFVDLQPGDVIIQNGANSHVGLLVTQMAREMGVRTISIMRHGPHTQHIMQWIKDMGGPGDFVMTEEYVDTWKFHRLLEDVPKPKLALNCVGGKSASDLARVLGPSGTLVTYGGMSKQPVTLPASTLLHNDIMVKGFWMSRWNQEASKEDRAQMFADVTKMFEEGKLKMWVECHPFKDFKYALKKAVEPYQFRKHLLEMVNVNVA